MTSDRNRRVAEMIEREAQNMRISKILGYGSLVLEWYTDPALLGEMLGWFTKNTRMFELCVRNESNVLRWWSKHDATRMRSVLGVTINAAVADALIEAAGEIEK